MAIKNDSPAAVPLSGPRARTPSLALCMIVRNEEAHLRKCLLSAAPIADCIYITDTGSNDGTIEIAREFGAELRHFPWQNDFSAARNHAIANVAEDWILCLDADDFFPEDEARKIPDLINQTEAIAFTLEYHVIEGHTPAPGLKLFKNHLGIRYEGLIHESIHQSLERISRAFPKASGIKLHHVGYTEETSDPKLRRNLPLLIREWERTESAKDLRQSLYVGKSLANAWIQTGRELDGERLLVQLLDRLVENRERCDADWEIAILISLICLCHRQNRDVHATDFCDKYKAIFSAHPVFWLYHGICLFRIEAWKQALENFRAFETAWGKSPTFLSIPQCYTSNDLWDWQGQCLLRLKQYSEAGKYFQKCLEHSPDNPEYAIKHRLAASLQMS